MKTLSITKGLVVLFAAIAFSTSFISCSKDDNNNGGGSGETYGTTGNASGAQQNPPVATAATGTLTGSYDSRTNIWQYDIDWTALSSAATIVEIHGPADAGVNGNLLFTLTITVGGINGSATGNVTLTEEQETHLLANKCYYSILTAAHITGEIRGQVTAVTR